MVGVLRGGSGDIAGREYGGGALRGCVGYVPM